MTNEQKEQIINLRCQKKSYGEISVELGISFQTIHSYCKKIGLDGKAADMTGITTCQKCGKLIRNLPGRKPKKFCGKECRQSWWNSHLEEVTRKAIYTYTCEYCRKPFTAYGNNHRKYCTHACYVAARFGSEAATNE